MKIVIDLDKYQLEHCKRHVEERYSNLIEEAVVKGDMLDDLLDKISAKIEPKCDRINSLASLLPYTTHREIQELLCEIMNLCKAESEGKE